MSCGSSLVDLGSVHTIPFQKSLNMLKPKDSQHHPSLRSLYICPVNTSRFYIHTHIYICIYIRHTVIPSGYQTIPYQQNPMGNSSAQVVILRETVHPSSQDI